MSRIIFATGNQNKMREIREIMQGFRVNGEEIEILSMKEAGVYTDIVEDGMTFVENAQLRRKRLQSLLRATLSWQMIQGWRLMP